MSAAAPVLVEVTRGDLVESRHRGAFAVSDAGGRIRWSEGDIARPIYARSAIKPLQALPLIESGAAAAFGCSPAEIALACASHDGEPVHTAAVSAWLARLGLGVDALECGSHAPYDPTAAAGLIRRNEAPCPLHNNCSGKHAGFLTLARRLGVDHRGYIGYAHPVQQATFRVLEEMAGLDLQDAPRGIDGCGIPQLGLPLRGLARAMARMADPSDQTPARAAACRTVREAMAAHPVMVAGHNRFCTRVIAAAGGDVLVKTGAEGVFCAFAPARGLGIALKIEDGATRASEVALLALLHRLDLLPEGAAAVLAPLARPAILNRAGRQVGEIRPAGALA